MDEDQEADAGALTEAFAGPRREAWTGVQLTGTEGLLPRLEIWLAGTLAPYGRLRGTPEAEPRGVLGPAVRDRYSLAYLTFRGDSAPYELVVLAHGPGAPHLATLLTDAVRRFAREARDADPVVRAYRRDDPDIPGGLTVDKPTTRLTIT